MSELFSGSIEGVGIESLLLLLAGAERSGQLLIDCDRWTAEITVSRGELVAASFGEAVGLPALEAAVLALTSGRFRFVQGSRPDSERNIYATSDQLQEYLKRLAILQHTLGLPKRLLDAVPHQVSSAESGLLYNLTIDRQVLLTLAAIDGQRTVASVAQARGAATAIMDLITLAELRLIRVIEGPPKPRPGIHQRVRIELLAWWRPLIMTALAAVLLLLNGRQTASIPLTPPAPSEEITYWPSSSTTLLSLASTTDREPRAISTPVRLDETPRG